MGCETVVGIARKEGFKGVKCCRSLAREMKELPVAVEKYGFDSGDGNLQKRMNDGMMLEEELCSTCTEKAEKITDVED